MKPDYSLIVLGSRGNMWLKSPCICRRTLYGKSVDFTWGASELSLGELICGQEAQDFQ